MSVQVRPRRTHHDDSIRRHSINMALMSDVNGNKPRDFDKGSRDFDKGSRDFAIGSRDFDKGSRDFDKGSRDFDKGSRDFAKGSRDHIRQVSLEDHLVSNIETQTSFAEEPPEEDGPMYEYPESVDAILSSLLHHQEPDTQYHGYREPQHKDHNTQLEDVLPATPSSHHPASPATAYSPAPSNPAYSPAPSETSLDASVLQTATSRAVSHSLANQLVAASLNIEEELEEVEEGVIWAEKVPCVSDIPRPSIASETLEGPAVTPSVTPSVTPAKPDIYTLVETQVKVKIPDTQPALKKQESPIYSKVIKTIPGTDPRFPESGSITKLSEVPLTQDETQEVITFISATLTRPSTSTPKTRPISVKEVDKEENVNDLSDMKLDGAKPKLSFLNKLKKSFGKTDKKQPNIPQLSRPPSTYIGSQTSLNGSDHSQQRGVSSPALEKPQTPVMDLLAKNPEMCSQDSLNRLTRGGDVRAVMSDPDLANSVATGRSRSKRPRDGKVKEKRRSRSRSLSKFMSDMARKAKSLTEVSPIPPQGEHPGSPTYQHQPLAPPTPLSPPPPIRAEQVPEEQQKPPKKKISLVGRIKRSLSIGKGDKEDKLSKKKELSKSTPTLSEPRDSLSALPPHIKRARSSENMSTTSSLTSTDVRTQIVLKSAKINKGCRCQVCSLVRRNIRSHCGSRDPHSKHKYEVVLKMNLLGTDFMNSECGSISSHQELLGCEVPDRPVVEGCDVITNDLITGGSEGNCNQLRTKTQSEIQEILHDFREETGSVSSSNTDVDISDIGNVTSTSSPRQSAV